MLALTDVDLTNKRVIIREDLNVPIKQGKITNDTRVRAILPTIKTVLANNAKVIILSHLDRPTEGEFEQRYSLKPVAEYLQQSLKKPVRLVSNWLDGFKMNSCDVVLCENVRFNVGEKANNPELAKKIANLCDVFVMDAFAVAHRAHASTVGVAQFAPVACAGPLLIKEIEGLNQALRKPKHPVVAIIGGAKVSTKLSLINSLKKYVDQLIVGGGIANTFIAAKGFTIGKSLYEAELIDQAKQIMASTNIPIPEDVVVAKEFSANAKAIIKSVNEVADNEMILDVGPSTAQQYQQLLHEAGTIIWNGPVGVFEFDSFAKGTQALAEAIANSQAFSIAGGGDTIAAIEKFNIASKVSYISTGGGAFLQYIENHSLPAIDILEARGQV